MRVTAEPNGPHETRKRRDDALLEDPSVLSRVGAELVNPANQWGKKLALVLSMLVLGLLVYEAFVQGIGGGDQQPAPEPQLSSTIRPEGA